MVLLKGFQRSTSSVSCLLLTLLASYPLTADAQDFQPRISWGASSVFIEGKAMYVTAGSIGRENISQTFSLDLSSPWTTVAPKFTKLIDVRSPTDYQIPSALDTDQVGWLLVSRTHLYRYDISDNEWGMFGDQANLFPVDDLSLQATVDPVSNSFLIPNGFITPTATGSITSMLRYDIKNDKTTSVSMANGPIDHAAASVVWSKHINKLIMFGGSFNGTPLNTLHTYNSASGWAAITPTNAGPSPRAFHCAVVVSNGTKMVVFGGKLPGSSTTFFGDIFVLDLITWTWFPGTALNSNLTRSNTACGATGDYFVSWGGSGPDNKIVSSNITLLFNIKTMSWTDSFVPPPTPPEEKKSKVGMIAGIAAGVVVLLAIVGFMFYRRSKRPQDGKSGHGKDGDDVGGVAVIPISVIDANHIWQPPTLAAQPDPGTPVVDPYALQKNRHQSVYDHQQPVYDQQQQQQYLNYNQQQPVNAWPSPTVHTDSSPTTTGYSATAYSPDQQQYQYTDGTHAYKSDEGYVLPPVGGGGNVSKEYKTEHTPENPNSAPVNHGRGPQAPQLHGDPPLDLENKTSSGVTIRNKYAD
ncbi:hypothetical protein BGZ93_007358 [Podila epicladia]|nr:hypothetical protein BGZ92_001548 [Podila epicladia]KAG0094324.1 hypothetical protein BGZ93_007358 [Podila epicladia]